MVLSQDAVLGVQDWGTSVGMVNGTSNSNHREASVESSLVTLNMNVWPFPHCFNEEQFNSDGSFCEKAAGSLTVALACSSRVLGGGF